MTTQHIISEEECYRRHRPLYWMAGTTLTVVCLIILLVGWALRDSATTAAEVANVAADLRVEIRGTNEYRSSTDAKLTLIKEELTEVKRAISHMATVERQENTEKKLDLLLRRSNEGKQ